MSQREPNPDRIQMTVTPLSEEREVAGDTIEFEYEYPFVDTSSNSRTVKHEPIGEEPVIDHMGPSAQQLTLQGHCYRHEANQIDNLTEVGRIRIMSDRWFGDAVVDQAETTATGSGGGKVPGTENRLFDYRIVLLELNGRAPTLEEIRDMG